MIHFTVIWMFYFNFFSWSIFKSQISLQYIRLKLAQINCDACQLFNRFIDQLFQQVTLFSDKNSDQRVLV